MNSKLYGARTQYLKKNMVSYEELLRLSDNQCVRVNHIYFHFLMAKAQLLGIKDITYYEILRKYLEIDNMQHYVNENKRNVTTYYVMSVGDVKYLINILGESPNFNAALMKSDISALELNERHDLIRRQYDDKRNNVKDNENNVGVCLKKVMK